MTLKLEKQQVLFLAGGLSEVLADLAVPGDLPPAAELELETAAEPEWAVGSIQLAYDPAQDRVILVAREVAAMEERDEGDEGQQEEEVDTAVLRGPVGESDEVKGSSSSPGVARLLLTRAQAAAMVERGKKLLQSGRPPCPVCGYPLSEDHSCPKLNGHKAPAL